MSIVIPKNEVVCLKPEVLETLVNDSWKRYYLNVQNIEGNRAFFTFGESLKVIFADTELKFKYDMGNDKWYLTNKEDENE